MDEKRYDVESLKARLAEYLDNERDIDNQIERLERLTSKMIGVGAQILTDMPKAPSASNDRMADMLGQKDELEASIRAAVTEQSRERQRIEEILKHLRNPDERAVIRIHYFDREKWPEVSKIMFGSKPDYEGKEETYLRRAHRIHGSALLNMAKWIDDHSDPNTEDTATM